MCVAGTVLTQEKYTYGGYRSAVCAEHPMVAGTHYVEVTLLEDVRGFTMGVVGQGYDEAGRKLAWPRPCPDLDFAAWLTDTETQAEIEELGEAEAERRERVCENGRF